MIAHQGGWDEILLVAGPILVIVVLIAVAQRRTRALGQRPTAGSDHEPQPPAPIKDR